MSIRYYCPYRLIGYNDLSNVWMRNRILLSIVQILYRHILAASNTGNVRSAFEPWSRILSINRSPMTSKRCLICDGSLEYQLWPVCINCYATYYAYIAYYIDGDDDLLLWSLCMVRQWNAWYVMAMRGSIIVYVASAMKRIMIYLMDRRCVCRFMY